MTVVVLWRFKLLMTSVLVAVGVSAVGHFKTAHETLDVHSLSLKRETSTGVSANFRRELANFSQELANFSRENSPNLSQLYQALTNFPRKSQELIYKSKANNRHIRNYNSQESRLIATLRFVSAFISPAPLQAPQKAYAHDSNLRCPDRNPIAAICPQ